HLQAAPIGQPLQTPLPETRPAAVAAAAVRQDQQPLGLSIALAAAADPPTAQRINREGRRVRRGADHDMPLVDQKIVETIGDGPTNGVADEVMSVDLKGLLQPNRPVVGEITHQLLSEKPEMRKEMRIDYGRNHSTAERTNQNQPVQEIENEYDNFEQR